MTVDIQATFSKKEKPRNGLENIAKDLIEDPLTPRYAVVRFFSPNHKVNNLDGTDIPVVRFDYVEPMLSDADEAAARKLLDRAYKARCGHMPEATLLGAKDDEHERDETNNPDQEPLPLDETGQE